MGNGAVLGNGDQSQAYERLDSQNLVSGQSVTETVRFFWRESRYAEYCNQNVTLYAHVNPERADLPFGTQTPVNYSAVDEEDIFEMPRGFGQTYEENIVLNCPN